MFRTLLRFLRGRAEGLSLTKTIKLLITLVVTVMAILILLIFSIEIWHVRTYNSILNNVTKASEFNQNFKDEVDLKMYYFVIDSQYSEGLPVQTVRDAEQLAQELLDTTTEKESIRAITSVLNLCGNLEDKIERIAECDSYDERQVQLENNIYILTDLIQEYMYTYLYHEAAHLNTVQSSMFRRIFIIIGVTLLLTAACILMLIRQSGRISHSVTDPVSELCDRVRAISFGDFSVREPVPTNIAEIQTLSKGFEDMVGQLNTLMEKNRIEERQRRNVELALLQAQINPHFLYNTLDTIVWLIESGDYERSVAMVGSLSGFFRHSLSKGMDVITIAQEEKHIRCYLEIQQVRYMDILEYSIDIPDEICDCRLPKLTLQPLVENALYHGVKLRRRMGHIRVSGERRGEYVVLTVSDDGAGMEADKLAEVREALASPDESLLGFGLRTVQQRLRLLFGDDCGVTVDSEPDKGTVISVTLPFSQMAEVLE